MSKFEIGDKVKILKAGIDTDKIGQVKKIINITSEGIFLEGCRAEWTKLEDVENWLQLVEKNNKINKTNKMTNLIEKFKLTLKGEPEKTLIKTGIMNTDETLTSEGKDLFFEWLFQQNKQNFTDEVATKILEEQEKDSK